MKPLLITLVIVLLSGCANRWTEERIAAADYGPYPNNYEAQIKHFLSLNLKDPDSVQYGHFEQPKKVMMYNAVKGRHFGYMVCMSYNAKNSFGGYAGYSTEGFFFKDGNIFMTLTNGYFYGEYHC